MNGKFWFPCNLQKGERQGCKVWFWHEWKGSLGLYFYGRSDLPILSPSSPPPLFKHGFGDCHFRVSETSKNHYNFWLIFNNGSDTNEFISWCKDLLRTYLHVNQCDYIWALERNRMGMRRNQVAAWEAAKGLCGRHFGAYFLSGCVLLLLAGLLF